MPAPWIGPAITLITELVRARRERKAAKAKPKGPDVCQLPPGHQGACDGWPCETGIQRIRENEGADLYED